MGLFFYGQLPSNLSLKSTKDKYSGLSWAKWFLCANKIWAEAILGNLIKSLCLETSTSNIGKESLCIKEFFCQEKLDKESCRAWLISDEFNRCFFALLTLNVEAFSERELWRPKGVTTEEPDSRLRIKRMAFIAFQVSFLRLKFFRI